MFRVQGRTRYILWTFILALLVLFPAQSRASSNVWLAGFDPVILAPTQEVELPTPSMDDNPPSIVTMEQAVQWALAHNHDLERLRFDVQAAEAGARGADALYMPTLTVGGRIASAGPSDTISLPIPDHPLNIQILDTAPVYTASATLSQPVYTFGAIPLARRAASLALDQATLQLRRAEQKLSSDVESAFLQASLTSALVDVANGAVATSQERLRISQERYDAGTAARFEVLRSEVSLATTQEQLLQAQTASELAMSALIQKLGLPQGSTIEILPPDPESIEPVEPPVTLEEAQQTAMQNRPDLQSLQVALQLTQVGVESERNRPMLAFQGSYSHSDHASGFQQKDNWSLGLNLSYLLFDGGRARAAIDQAESTRDSVSARLDEAESLVSLEVQNAYLTLTKSLDRIEVARTTLESAREAVRIAQLGYTEGVITYIDYQDADLGYRQAETMFLQAVYGYLIAQSGLDAAMGNM